jgi:iron complex outermembrane receptor protein
VTRDPNLHKVTGLFAGLNNVGGVETEGYDLGANYRLPELAIGRISINWQSSYTSVYDQKADKAPDTQWIGQVGTPGFFRIRSNLGVSWEKGDYSLSYMARYYSGMKEDCVLDKDGNPTRPCNDVDHVDVLGNPDPLRRVGSNTFHDLQFSVRLPWNATASIGANNITDHAGPIMFSQPNSNFSYYGGFDIGRFWYMKYQQRF